jgi:NitT/TauT family transport system ATP-binding protein
MTEQRPDEPLMVEVRGLGHTYGSGPSAHRAIEQIDFAIPRGQFVTIVGPSGCGKSTLLRCVAGLMASTHGEVVIDGDTITAVPEGMAIVFQDYSRSLFPWMRIAANVDFPLSELSLSRAERDERVRESLAAVGLEGFGDRYPWQLSGGMQQRAAIARALACHPRILLMDEPFASVDAQTRAELEDLTVQLHERTGVTIVLVTHDIDESVYVADRVLVLSRAPTRIVTDLPAPLPRPRDQIATKESEEFVHLRAEVARLIREQSTRTTVDGSLATT